MKVERIIYRSDVVLFIGEGPRRLTRRRIEPRRASETEEEADARALQTVRARGGHLFAHEEPEESESSTSDHDLDEDDA